MIIHDTIESVELSFIPSWNNNTPHKFNEGFKFYSIIISTLQTWFFLKSLDVLVGGPVNFHVTQSTTKSNFSSFTPKIISNIIDESFYIKNGYIGHVIFSYLLYWALANRTQETNLVFCWRFGFLLSQNTGFLSRWTQGKKSH